MSIPIARSSRIFLVTGLLLIHGLSCAPDGPHATAPVRVRGAAGEPQGKLVGVGKPIELPLSDRLAKDWAGNDIALSGDLLVVGAPQGFSEPRRLGKAHVLVHRDGHPGERFGLSVAIDDHAIAIGAHADRPEESGAGFVVPLLSSDT